MNTRYYMKDEGNFFSVEESGSRRPRVIAFIIVFFLLLVALGFAINYFMNRQATKIAVAAPSPTPMPTQIPSDTPAATPSAVLGTKTTHATPTVTPKTVAKATSTTEISPTATSVSASVEVLNGSGVSGAASKMASTLKSLGYTVSSTGNADTFEYKDITIEVKKSEPKLLTQLKNDLSADYTIGSSSASLGDSNDTDAIVIVGQ